MDFLNRRWRPASAARTLPPTNLNRRATTMPQPSADLSDDALEPIDLDRLIIDIDYRRAVLQRLKAESGETPEPGARRGRPHGASSRKAAASPKD